MSDAEWNEAKLMCQKYHIQACHECNDYACCDNMDELATPSEQKNDGVFYRPLRQYQTNETEEDKK